MNIKKLLIYPVLFLLTWACTTNTKETQTTQNEQEKTSEKVVNVYTHRHYDTDKALYAEFTKKTGIEVKIQKANADELIQRLEQEGANSPADVLVTVDAGRLHRAKEKQLLQAIQSDFLTQTIPTHLRDADNMWFGLTKRARIIIYSKERVKPEDLSTYEALTDEKWKSKVLVRSSQNIYNQSLMASMVSHLGEDGAKNWASGVVANMARSPKGNDRDQAKAIAAGEGDIAIVNSYYIGRLLQSDNKDERKVGEAVGVFFPNQDDRGSHINVSGISVTKHAPHRENAIKLIEFLLSKEAQEQFSQAGSEYPVNTQAASSALLQSWGTFKEDQLDLSQLGVHNTKAVILFDEAGWK